MGCWKRCNAVAMLAVLITACGSGGSGGSSGDSSDASTGSQTISTPTQESVGGNQSVVQQAEQLVEDLQVTQQTELEQQAITVNLTGTVVYDRVPFGTQSYSGLDYSATYAAPVRGATVQVINASNSVLASTKTNNQGIYSLDVAPNSEVKIRVLAELLSTEGAVWDIQVKDNTSGNAVYILEGALASVGANATQSRDLHAKSGWVGTTYAESRSAAPFAVLDSIYDALVLVAAADSTAVLPPLSVYWSVNNIAISGNVSAGNIGTSYYTSAGPSIYLLGKAGNDSDEYDRAVIQHEFGHYLEHQVGRTESIGGGHNQYSKLDMRVAFGEGWGNAFAGMVSGDPIYRDSLSTGQQFGYSVDVDQKPRGDHGWYSENSVQGVLYDLFDGGSQDDDGVALGFTAIYSVFTSQEYLGFDGLANIYSFVEQAKAQNTSSASAIEDVMFGFEIYGMGWWGVGETNSGNTTISLPIYKSVSVGNSTVVCSSNSEQEYNGLGVRQFVRVTIAAKGNYLISVTRDSGSLVNTNPQLRLFQAGSAISASTGSQTNYETMSRTLNAGDYVLEVYEELNVDNLEATGGQVCFNVTLS